MKIGKPKSILFALGMGVLAWPSMAGAATFVQTSDDCSSTAPCGITANNKNPTSPQTPQTAASQGLV